MKRLSTALLLLCLCLAATAAGNLTLDDILSGTYAARGVYGVRPLADGEHYARMDGRKITTYSFQTGAETGVLFDAATAKGKTKIQWVDGYLMSPDERNILIHGRKRFYTEPRFHVGDKFLEPVWHRATLDLMAAIALVGPERFVGTVVSYRAGHTLDCDAIRALKRNDLLTAV